MNRAAVLVIAACSRDPVATCNDDLRGVYTVLSTASAADLDVHASSAEDPTSGERWMVLDDGATLEAYPLFPDGGADPALEIAPRVLDLTRSPIGLAGTLHRRYLRRADVCDAQAPVHVTRCADNLLELALADPAPPVGFAPCVWPRAAPSHIARWHRD